MSIGEVNQGHTPDWLQRRRVADTLAGLIYVQQKGDASLSIGRKILGTEGHVVVTGENAHVAVSMLKEIHGHTYPDLFVESSAYDLANALENGNARRVSQAYEYPVLHAHAQGGVFDPLPPSMEGRS